MLAQYWRVLPVVASVVLLALGRAAGAADLPLETPKEESENTFPREASRDHRRIPIQLRKVSRNNSDDPKEWTISLGIKAKDRNWTKHCRIGDVVEGYEIVDARFREVEVIVGGEMRKRKLAEIVVRSAAGDEYILGEH